MVVMFSKEAKGKKNKRGNKRGKKRRKRGVSKLITIPHLHIPSRPSTSSSAPPLRYLIATNRSLAPPAPEPTRGRRGRRRRDGGCCSLALHRVRPTPVRREGA